MEITALRGMKLGTRVDPKSHPKNKYIYPSTSQKDTESWISDPCSPLREAGNSGHSKAYLDAANQVSIVQERHK